MSCFNEFGDEQLAIDILANNVIFENLKASGAVATASSEETPTEDPMGGSGYSVAFDPLGEFPVYGRLGGWAVLGDHPSPPSSPPHPAQ